MGPEGAVNIVFRSELEAARRPGGPARGADRRLQGAVREPVRRGGARLRRRRDRARVTRPCLIHALEMPLAKREPRRSASTATSRCEPRSSPSAHLLAPVTDIETPPRTAIPVELTWDAESVFPSVEAWEEELEAILAAVPAVAAFQGRLAEGPAVLAEALAARDLPVRRQGQVFVYAILGYAVETTDQAAVARFGRAQSMQAQVDAALAFVEPEVLALGRERIVEWTASEPTLAPYAHHFDDLFRQEAHTRSAEVEQVLGLAGDVFGGPYTIYSALTDSDITFAPASSSSGEQVEVAQGSIDALLARVRPGAPTQRVGELRRRLPRRPQHACREPRGRGQAGRVRDARPPPRLDARGIARAHERPHRGVRQPDRGIPGEPPDLASLLGGTAIAARCRRSAALRRVRAARGRTAVARVRPVRRVGLRLARATRDCVRRHRQAGCGEERWIDALPSAGKMAGAFSAGAPGTRPFIMMSFDGTAVSLGTLAHELGHSMHSYLTWETQPQVYTHYSLFVAEVASNFHQALLRAHLLEVLDDRQLELAVLEEAMANLHRYLFVMPTLARFERELHQRVERGEGVTADQLVEGMADLFEEGFGPDVDVDRDRMGITWAQFGHLYAPFYVFQYATGIAGAHALARGVLAGVKGSADRYLEFLSAGDSLYPARCAPSGRRRPQLACPGPGGVRRARVVRRSARGARLARGGRRPPRRRAGGQLHPRRGLGVRAAPAPPGVPFDQHVGTGRWRSMTALQTSSPTFTGATCGSVSARACPCSCRRTPGARRARIAASAWRDTDLNRANAELVQAVAAEGRAAGGTVLVGGLLGPAGRRLRPVRRASPRRGPRPSRHPG